MANLKGTEKNIEDRRLNQQTGGDEYYKLSNSADTEQHLRANADNNSESSQYDSSQQRHILHNVQKSFDGQREQYTEKAYNDYDNPVRQQVQEPVQQIKQSDPNVRNTYDYEQQISSDDEQDVQEFQRRCQSGNIGEILHTAAGIAEILQSSHDIFSDVSSEHSERQKPLKKAPVKTGLTNEPDEIKRLSRKIQKERLMQNKLEEPAKLYEIKTKNKKDKAAVKKQTGRLLFQTAKKLFNDEEIEEDDVARGFNNFLRHSGNVTSDIISRNIEYLRKTNSPKAKLEALHQRERYHVEQRNRLQDKHDLKAQKENVKNAATKEERKRRKKEMYKWRKEHQGNFIRRTYKDIKFKKSSSEYKIKQFMKALKKIFSFIILAVVLCSGFIIVFLIILCIFHGGEETYSSTVVQVDYGGITEATEYFRSLETDLEEYVTDTEELEKELQKKYGPDIYEFIYNLPEFSFSANTLVAYLASKYGEFELNEATKAELKDILQQMYNMTIKIVMENREVEDTSITDENGKHPTKIEQKKICYITIEKKELEDVVEPKLTETQLEQYDVYKLSTGGQQVYSPVMKEDWTNKISSAFGDRIHPISGERKQHKGVDIAVPVGTKLYSAVTGTVTAAHYSDSAGYMVTIKRETGWSVTYMHMNGFVVTKGQTVKKGDFIGESGNTGNSTGPHLHLQVNDSDGNAVNPIFIIPQTCAGIE